PEQVAEAASEQEEAAVGEDVAAGHPLQVLLREPRSPWMDGSATLTIAESAMSRNCTAHSSTRVIAPSLDRRASREPVSGQACPWTDPIPQASLPSELVS